MHRDSPKGQRHRALQSRNPSAHMEAGLELRRHSYRELQAIAIL
jgi:hypothetical protein